MLNRRLAEANLDRGGLLDALGVRNSVREPCFDSLVRVAADAVRSPTAVLSFCEDGKVWVKASTGWADDEAAASALLPRLMEGMTGVLTVEDFHADPRFSVARVPGHSEAVAFAGVPIAYGGQFIGTLGVLDSVPRAFSLAETSLLQNLSSLVEGLLDSRMARWLLVQDEAEARTFSEISSDWTWITDRHDRYVRIRGATFAAKIGLAPESLVGRGALTGPLVDLLGQPVVPLRTFDDLIATREAFDGALVQLATASGPLIVSRSGIPRFVADGFDGFYGVSTDVTALIEANKALHEATAMKEAAERANKGKTRFISQVSHEFRTPLNAIMGFTQLLQMDEANFTSSQMAQLRHIQDASDRLLALTNDMLNLGRIENGGLALESTSVALGDVVRSALLLVANMAAEQRITIEVDLAGEWQVRGDPRALDQVVTNLVSNAVKYNRAGGHVRIRAHGTPSTLTLHVEDTGRGLTEAQLANLYEPFNRLGAERSSVPGTGLGLVITKALVEAMRGSVSVTSEPGAGTHVQVHLPRGAAVDKPAA